MLPDKMFMKSLTRRLGAIIFDRDGLGEPVAAGVATNLCLTGSRLGLLGRRALCACMRHDAAPSTVNRGLTMYRRLLLALAGAALALVFGPATSSFAACYSATPTSQSFADPIGDADSGLAPDITSVDVQVTGNCSITAGSPLGSLVEGDAVFIYLDTDGNPNTGETVFGGADRVVGTLGETGADSPPMLGTYDAALGKLSFTNAPTLTPSGNGGFTASVDQLGIAPNSTLGIAMGTSWDGIYNTYFDFAPDAAASDSAFRMPINYNTQAPAPAPAPTPAPAPASATQPTFGSPSPQAQQCMVPATKRKTVSAARKALRASDCKVGGLRRTYSSRIKVGLVVRTNPGANRMTRKAVTLYVSRGPARKHRRAAKAGLSTEQRLNAILSSTEHQVR
jgi:hypothetical protein